MRGPNLSQWALEHRPLVRFLLVLFALGGVYAYEHLGRKEDPEFTFKAMLVQTYWPGASARQVADQVTDRIEKALQQIAEIDYTRSYSRAGESQITVSLLESVPAGEVADVWYRVRKKVNDIAHTLPTDVRGPHFNDEFGDTYGNVFALTWDGFSYAEAKEFAEAARNEFLQVPDVMKVDLLGEQEERIYVETAAAKLATLGIDPAAIVDTLEATNSVEAAGTVEGDGERVHVRVTGAFYSVESIRDLGVESGGQVFRLGDVASVRRGYADPPESKMRFQGREALGIAISMREGGDVLQLGDRIDEVVAQMQAQFPVGIEIHAVSDQPRVVRESIDEFVRSLAEAVAIVLAVSFLSLGWRAGLVVALTIPLVLAITFLVMFALGIDLQRVSLGALIIALGLLVDDAIIAVEMMSLKLEHGWDRVRAATHAYRSTAFPMLTGTLITAAGFLPVGLARSNAGEYTFSMFQVVGIALIVSWVVAVLFTPYIAYVVLPERRHVAVDEDAVYARPAYRWFRRLVTRCLEHRRLVVAGTLGMFVCSLAFFRLVPEQFFPESDRPELLVDLWLPQAASYAATEQALRAMERRLVGDPDVASVTSYVGVGSPRFYLPLDQQTPNRNFGQLIVMTRGADARERVLPRVDALLVGGFEAVRGRVSRLENGPPVGYPLQYRVSGPDDARVELEAARVAAVLRGHASVRRVNSDADERTSVMRVDVDQDKARVLGFSPREIARTLQVGLSGVATTQFREGDESIDVVVRLDAPERSDLGSLDDVLLYQADGRPVALGHVAALRLEGEDGVLWRRNRTPTITVKADVEGAQANDVAAALEPDLAALRADLPLGYAIEVAGSTEASAVAGASIMAATPYALVVVLLLLMLQLQDSRRMLLVLATGPLGLIGVALLLAMFRVPFGFVAMLGAIAVFGMILRNSVILVAQIDANVAAGLAPEEAVVEAAVRRLRPIVLTALAATCVA
ncbi:MAG: multidrug transporter AcrB [Steroidobacteraceae bacterium]|nr:multidrug transporter AcrB [Steroidobacteraceae bacterium]